MRRILALALIMFSVTLALIVSTHLSEEMLAVLLGIAFGIAVTLPVSLGLWIALTHHWNYDDFYADEDPRAPAVPAPPSPILYMASPVHSSPPYKSTSRFVYSTDSYASAPQRDFRIVGDQ